MACNVFDSAEHIRWTLERDPKVYAMMRDILIDLRQCLVNSELKYQDSKKEVKS